MVSIIIAVKNDPGSAWSTTQKFIEKLEDGGEEALFIELFKSLLKYAKLPYCAIPAGFSKLLARVQEIKKQLTHLPLFHTHNEAEKRTSYQVLLVLNSVVDFDIDLPWAKKNNSSFLIAIITGGFYGFQGKVCRIRSVHAAGLQVMETAPAFHFTFHQSVRSRPLHRPAAPNAFSPSHLPPPPPPYSTKSLMPSFLPATPHTATPLALSQLIQQPKQFVSHQQLNQQIGAHTTTSPPVLIELLRDILKLQARPEPCSSGSKAEGSKPKIFIIGPDDDDTDTQD